MQEKLTVVRQADRPVADFGGGATYHTIVADDNCADVPVRTGVQTSPPGYATRVHSHPYVEILTVLAGRGEAWLEDRPGVVVMEPGITVVVAPHTRHAFRALGEEPLVTYGVHCNGKRIVQYQDD
jgi:mannose-6-phosphate isomerase-like protein (cupin superfamily)